jgi:predicted DNA-binding ribbon-helix-helix protein
MAHDLKRSVTIRGHRTSLSLEREFWDQLNAVAQDESVTVAALIAQIDSQRDKRNLSSAIRVFLLHKLQTH